MATTPMPDGFQGPNTNNVANDFSTAFVGSANNYSTTMNQQLALPVPLGSQLNLLDAQNMGNPYIQGDRMSDMMLGPMQNSLVGYNTLTGIGRENKMEYSAPYFSMSSAYGKY